MAPVIEQTGALQDPPNLSDLVMLITGPELVQDVALMRH
jgi:hypothetical protein